jgi:hypothetical protein
LQFLYVLSGNRLPRELPTGQTIVSFPGTAPQDGGVKKNRLQQQLAAARSEMKFMSATIQEQRAEIESSGASRHNCYDSDYGRN